MWRDTVEFWSKYTQMRILEHINNKVIYEHFVRTPNKATEDTWRSIVLENIRFLQRRIDQRSYKMWLELQVIGKRIDPSGGWELSSTDIERLKKERGYLNEDEQSTQHTH